MKKDYKKTSRIADRKFGSSKHVLNRKRLSEIPQNRPTRNTDETYLLNEQHFSDAFRNSPVIVFNHDRNLRYTWIFDMTKDKILRTAAGKTDKELIKNPEEARRLIEIKKRALRTGKGRREEVAITLNKKLCYYDLRVEPLRNGKGKIIGLACAAIDITERKRAESVLLHTKELLEKIASASTAIIAVHDLKTGKNIYNNRSLSEILGHSKKERVKLPGTTESELFSLVHPEDIKIFTERHKVIAKMKDGRSHEIEYRLRDRNGSWQRIKEIYCVLDRDKFGIPSQLMSTYENITAERINQQELREGEEKFRTLF